MPIRLGFAPGDIVLGMRWPLIEDELTVTHRLHSVSLDWTISVVTSAACRRHNTRLATAAAAFSYHEVRAAEAARQEAARKAAETKKALQEQAKAEQKKQKQAAPGLDGKRRGGRGGRGRGKGKGTGKDDGAEGAGLEPPPDGKVSKRMLPAESSDSGSTTTDTSTTNTGRSCRSH